LSSFQESVLIFRDIKLVGHVGDKESGISPEKLEEFCELVSITLIFVRYPRLLIFLTKLLTFGKFDVINNVDGSASGATLYLEYSGTSLFDIIPIILIIINYILKN
jgi:hypothetical protein